MFNIIKKSYLWIGIAVALMVSSMTLFFMNIRYSIEFTGGMQVSVEGDFDASKLESDVTTFISEIEEYNLGEVEVGVSADDTHSDILLKMDIQDDEMVNFLSENITEYLISSKHIESKANILETKIIGPSVGEYMKDSAKKAIIFGVLFMGIYILFAFSGLRHFLSPVLLAGVTAFTMLFDISIPAGAYGILMGFNHTFQVDIIFIIALLTIMGYSINDTIVIFDRIRESLITNKEKVDNGSMKYSEIFETALWTTMRRSMGTSISTLLVVAAMYIFGTGLIKVFAFNLMIGVIAGTYSSIFVAAPLVYVLSGKMKKESK